MRRIGSSIRLFAEDGTFLRWLNVPDLEEYSVNREIEDCFENRGGVLRKIGVKLCGKEHGSKNTSPCTITMADSLANVGITRGEASEPAKRGRVLAAQSKIDMWPLEHDRRAVVISAGKVFGATLMSREAFC